MKCREHELYARCGGTFWKGAHPFQRLLAEQVAPQLEYYDRVASDWTEVEVLDLGCVPGSMAEALAARGARVTEIDPSRRMIASSKSERIAPRIEFFGSS